MERIETIIIEIIGEQLDNNINICFDVTMVLNMCIYTQQSLSMISLKERTRGVDIFKALGNFLTHLRIPVFKF